MFKKIINWFKKPKPTFLRSLIMCPSQISCYFKSEGEEYQLYLRWRHYDPWSATIIRMKDDQWNEIYVPFFTHDEYPVLEKYCVKYIKKHFKNVKFVDNPPIDYDTF